MKNSKVIYLDKNLTVVVVNNLSKFTNHKTKKLNDS